MPSHHILKVGRLENLYDGVFAIAMTILVLDLHLPRGLSLADLHAFLQSETIFRLFIYAGSFIILGTQWIAMNFQLGLLDHINRPYLWTNILFLLMICIIPFSASLVASYPHAFASMIFYAINLTLTSFGQLLTIQCAHYFKLNQEQYYTPAIRRVVIRRILLAPLIYAIALTVAYWNGKLAFFMLMIPTVMYLFPGKIDKYDK